MLDLLKPAAFLFLFFRYTAWVMVSFAQTVYSPRIFWAQLVEGLLVFFFFVQLFSGKMYFPMGQSLGVQIVGFICVSTGVVLAFVAKKTLGKEWTYASSYKKQKGEHIITSGIYGYIRHPIYIGILLSYVGIELVIGSWLWISMLLFIIPFYFQARKEEKFLLEKFGEEYKKYMGMTKMFVPKLF